VTSPAERQESVRRLAIASRGKPVDDRRGRIPGATPRLFLWPHNTRLSQRTSSSPRSRLRKRAATRSLVSGLKSKVCFCFPCDSPVIPCCARRRCGGGALVLSVCRTRCKLAAHQSHNTPVKLDDTTNVANRSCLHSRCAACASTFFSSRACARHPPSPQTATFLQRTTFNTPFASNSDLRPASKAPAFPRHSAGLLQKLLRTAAEPRRLVFATRTSTMLLCLFCPMRTWHAAAPRSSPAQAMCQEHRHRC
jgi:hypothetical protein